MSRRRRGHNSRRHSHGPKKKRTKKSGSAGELGRIYAYTVPAYSDQIWHGRRQGRGLLKVGYTSRNAHERIREQIGASSPEKKPYTLVLDVPARTRTGRRLTDHEIHRMMKSMGVHHVHKEWFEATGEDVQRAIVALGGPGRSKPDHGHLDFKTVAWGVLFCAASFAFLYPEVALGYIDWAKQWARYYLYQILQIRS